MTIDVISTQVQGAVAADQIIAAVRQFNELSDPPEVLAILRGGGSRDDLAVFDDEKLARTVAASRIPTITGVGHEIDTTLIDLVADKRASTPSNAAELLVPDRRELIHQADDSLAQMVGGLVRQLEGQKSHLASSADRLSDAVQRKCQEATQRVNSLERTLIAYNPRAVLTRGYAIIWRNQHAVQTASVGDKLTIETAKELIDTEVKNARSK